MKQAMGSFLLALGCAAITPYSAKATDFTLSDSAIMSLDYNMSNFFVPPPTASIVSKQDIPGTGVQFTIHFNSTNYPDYFCLQVSDKDYGAGTLAGIDVSGYSNYSLKFTLVSVDGSTSGSGGLDVGAVIGGGTYAYQAQIIGLNGFFPSAAVSSTPTSYALPTISRIGFIAYLWQYGGWSDAPHDITLLVEPADGAVQIPEPAPCSLLTLGVLALLGIRRFHRHP